MVAKRSTTMGKIMPYVDVRSKGDIPQFESMVKMGPVFVLVYADWCGHCRRFKDEMWDEVAKSPNKSVNTAAVHYNMVDKTSMKNANIEGYPTLFEVKPTPKSNVSKAVPTPQSKEELENLVNNANMNSNTNSSMNQNMMNSNTNSSMNQNMINSARMMESSRLATEETFQPDELSNLPPNLEEDEEMEEIINTTKPQLGGGHKGGSLLETLLKVSADTAHAVVLAGSAMEISNRLKKRRKTRRRSSKKKLTRKH